VLRVHERGSPAYDVVRLQNVPTAVGRLRGVASLTARNRETARLLSQRSLWGNGTERRSHRPKTAPASNGGP